MIIWKWVAALAILAIWSFIFKENKIYRCVQGLYLGMYAGVGLANGLILVWDLNLVTLFMGRQFLLVVPLLMGLLLYIRVFAPNNKYAWVSRIAMGFVIGVGTAVATFGAVNGQLIVQLDSTINSLLVYGDSGIDLVKTINSFIILVGVLAVFTYFLFSKSAENKIVKKTSMVGRYFMMVGFGVAFGSIITNRITSFMQALETVLYAFGR